MKRSIYLTLIYLYCCFIHADSISNRSDYPSFCKIASEDDAVFENFKSNPCYQLILEHATYHQGSQYLEIIKQEYPSLLSNLEKFKENDLLGAPTLYFYGENYGYISPTTLRYTKVAGDIISLFGDISNKTVVEIGGGYGGQCKILSTIFDFHKYFIFDLPEVCLLTRKYLDLLNVSNTECLSDFSHLNENDFDLVISNYAFSEISRNVQIEYIDKVINKSKCGYLTLNFISDYFSINSLSLEEILIALKKPERELVLLEERPLTGSKNTILIWTENLSH